MNQMGRKTARLAPDLVYGYSSTLHTSIKVTVVCNSLSHESIFPGVSSYVAMTEIRERFPQVWSYIENGQVSMNSMD